MEQGLQVKSLGIPWFRKEDYDEFRKLFVDRDNLFDTFEEWEAAATERERELKANDVPVVRIALGPKTFVAWCAEMGCQPVGPARARYAAQMAMERYTTN